MRGYQANPRDQHPAGRRAKTGKSVLGKLPEAARHAGVSLSMLHRNVGKWPHPLPSWTQEKSEHLSTLSKPLSLYRTHPHPWEPALHPAHALFNLARVSVQLLTICGLASAMSISHFRCTRLWETETGASSCPGGPQR